MKKIVIVLLGVFVVLFIIPASLYIIVFCCSAISLQNAYVELKKAGRPASLKEVIPHALPDEKNAAILYEKVIKILTSTSPIKDDSSSSLIDAFDKLNSTYLESDNNNLKSIIQSNTFKEAFSLIEKGNLIQTCRYDVDYKKGPSALLPHLSYYKKIIQLLCIKANIESTSKETDKAWHTIITGLKFANSLKDGPLLIDQLVRIKVFFILALQIQTLLETTTPDEKQAEELFAELKIFEDTKSFIKTFDTERLLIGEYIFNTLPFSLPIIFDGYNVSRTDFVLCYLVPTLKADRATYLRVINYYTQTAEDPYYQTKDAWKKVLYDIPEYKIISRSLLAIMPAYKIKYTSFTTKAKIMILGLKLIQFRQCNGKFPRQLEELGAIDIIDPFTGKTLIYKPEENGFLLYSVGSDLNDDGGKFIEESKNGDIGWHYTVKSTSD